MIIKKALYGLKSSGVAFRAHLAATLYDLGYKPTKVDPDVWIQPASKPNGFKYYYEMLLVYMNDILCISADPKATMHGIQETFKLKDDKIEKPNTLLGAQLKEMSIGGQMCWTVLYFLCIKLHLTIVLVHSTVDICVQFHGLMHTGDFKLLRGFFRR